MSFNIKFCFRILAVNPSVGYFKALITMYKNIVRLHFIIVKYAINISED